jgi:hypothetical protein
MCGRAKQRSKKKNQKTFFNGDYMTPENMMLLYVEQGCVCDECRLPMEFVKGIGNKNLNQVSPDQIDAGKGYVEGNVRLVHWQCNMMRNNSSLEAFRQGAANIAIAHKWRVKQERKSERAKKGKTARRVRRTKGRRTRRA